MSKLIRINDELIKELDNVLGNTYNQKISYLLGTLSAYQQESKLIVNKPKITLCNSKQIVNNNSDTNSKPIVNKLTNSIQEDSILTVNKLTDELTNSKQIVNKEEVNKELTSIPIVNNIDPWLTHKVKNK